MATSSKEMPNVLLICVEQWSGALTRPAGHPVIMTPTIAQLAGSGVYFTNAYSAVPTCIPARRSLMTGQTARTHGDRIFNEYQEMPDVPTLAQTFREAGYQAYAVGKMHVYPQRDRIGFNDVILNEEGRHHLGAGADDFELFLAEQGYAGQEFASGMCTNDYMVRPWHLPEYCHPTNWTTREMCKTIHRRDPQKPGFWFMSFNCIHPPVTPLREYLDIYRDIEVDMPRIGKWAIDSDSLPYALRGRSNTYGMHGATQEEIRLARQGWYAAATHVDHQIRTVLGYLREQGLLDNTIIAFMSDHGDMLGDHHQWAKALMYDKAANVPLLIIPTKGDSRLDMGIKDDRLVEVRDIMPTLLDLADIPIPETVEGISLLGDERREYLYGEHFEDANATRMIRATRFKLIYYPVGNRIQLFDMQADPYELDDLSADPAYEEVRERLTAYLIKEMYGGDREWISNGQLVGLPDQEYVPIDGRDLEGQRGWRFL